jgi:hypothetical protein
VKAWVVVSWTDNVEGVYATEPTEDQIDGQQVFGPFEVVAPAVSTIEELEAEVDRCRRALDQAKEALFKARTAHAKYQVGDWVIAQRTLPGHRYRDKTPWPAQILAVIAQRYEDYPLAYKIKWQLKDRTLSYRSVEVYENQIEGKLPEVAE